MVEEGAKQLKDVSEIEGLVIKIGRGIEAIQEAQLHLIDRISPVLSQESPKESSDIREAYKSPETLLGEKLLEILNRIDSLSSILENVHSRLRL